MAEPGDAAVLIEQNEVGVFVGGDAEAFLPEVAVFEEQEGLRVEILGHVAAHAAEDEAADEAGSAIEDRHLPEAIVTEVLGGAFAIGFDLGGGVLTEAEDDEDGASFDAIEERDVLGIGERVGNDGGEGVTRVEGLGKSKAREKAKEEQEPAHRTYCRRVV